MLLFSYHGKFFKWKKIHWGIWFLIFDKFSGELKLVPWKVRYTRVLLNSVCLNCYIILNYTVMGAPRTYTVVHTRPTKCLTTRYKDPSIIPTKIYGPLRGLTSSSCGGLCPWAEAFFGQKQSLLCCLGQFLVSSSNFGNFK